ncbi:MAG TPA: molybdopterin-binding protein, partial [Bacteroidota bacterium]|nr:molybdopterin-binding protein [Bacteroidota bacterium]
MISEIITIGDELLIGQVINTNQAFISDKLNSVGIFTEQMLTVGDVEPEILRAFESAWKQYDVVAVTGGLGPTHDDITRASICKFFKTDLIVDEWSLKNVREIFSRRGVQVTKINEEQALVPRGCTVMHNRLGTAPGYFFERDGKFFIVMPGVPYEMKGMIESFVLPYFEQRAADLVIRHRTLKTTGIPESFLAERIGDVEDLFPLNTGTTLAYLPSSAGVRMRITVRSDSIADAEKRLNDVESKIRTKVEKYIYATDDVELE